MANGSEGFEIPDQSIVKVKAEEGSVAWMKAVTKEHGDTDPQKLERRRERLSAFSVKLEDQLKSYQAQKKFNSVKFKEEYDKRKLALSKAKDGTPEYASASASLSEIEAERQATEQQYDILISDIAFKCAMIEGQCLLVDCLTLREPVKSKSGKIGLFRYTSALYACDTAYNSARTYNRTKKLYELLAEQYPAAAAKLSETDDEEDQESEIDDADVVTSEERRKIQESTVEDL